MTSPIIKRQRNWRAFLGRLDEAASVEDMLQIVTAHVEKAKDGNHHSAKLVEGLFSGAVDESEQEVVAFCFVEAKANKFTLDDVERWHNAGLIDDAEYAKIAAIVEGDK